MGGASRGWDILAKFSKLWVSYVVECTDGHLGVWSSWRETMRMQLCWYYLCKVVNVKINSKCLQHKKPPSLCCQWRLLTPLLSGVLRQRTSSGLKFWNQESLLKKLIFQKSRFICSVSCSSRLLCAHCWTGRQADICDVELEHPSISRQHAVIQFRDSG